MPPANQKKEKNPSGRPKHGIWGLGFRRVLKQDEKNHRAVHAAFCVLCNKVLCNTASKRLKAHRRICLLEHGGRVIETESDTKSKEITKIITPDHNTSLTFIDMDDPQHFDPDAAIQALAKTEYSFVDEPNESFPEMKHVPKPSNDSKVELAMAKFFIGCNIPFSVADSTHFKKFCLSLNNTYKTVTSEQLAGPLLDNVHSKFHKNVKIGTLSVLLIDGWKNENTGTRNVTIMLKTETNETIFLNNYELTSVKDIVQELTDITKMSMMEVTEQFRSKVYSVILGNNCSLVKMDGVNEVWQFPCNAYTIKLLTKEYICQDFMNTICKILRQLNTIFKDDDLENKISGELRWTNTKCILEYCMANLDTIQTMLSTVETIKLPQDYKVLFSDEEFIRKIEIYISFLNAIEELTLVCQNPKSNIADSAEQWLNLQFTEDESETTEKLIEQRDSVLKIQSLVANYLHPNYRGQRLSDDQMNKVEEFLLTELNSDGLNSLQSYVNGDTIFRVLNEKEGLSAQTYWSLARRTHMDLAALAIKLLAIPASITSDVSKIFNTVKNTSLKPDNLRKLFAVYYHLNEKEEKSEIE